MNHGRSRVLVSRSITIALVVVVCACDNSLDSPGEEESFAEDATSSRGESSDVDSDTESVDDLTSTSSSPEEESSESVLPGDPLNACGGTAELRWRGLPAGLLEPCGPFDEGALVCSGLESLQCAGEVVSVNVCGGSGVLAVEIGDSCGACGDGTWVCGQGGNHVRCIGASRANACGGCARMDAQPGEVCVSDGAEGTSVCTDRETIACSPGQLNACGGSEPLMLGG